jgi:putative salt-induced outer membrane protein YdiY
MTARQWLFVASTLVIALSSSTAAFAQDEEPAKGWDGSIAAGIALTQGTTDSFGGNLEAKAGYKWERDSLAFNATGIYSKSDGDITANNQQVGGEYRHNFTDRFFGFNNHSFGRDTVQLIQWRYVTVAGPGYRWWQGGEAKHFDTKGGIGYFHQEYLRDPPAAREDTRDDVTGNFSYEYSNLLFDTIEFLHTAGILVPLQHEDEFIVTTAVTASVPIALGWAFRNSFGLEYQNEPAADADDTNIRYTMGLEYKF